MLFRMLSMASLTELATEMRMFHTSGSLSLKIAIVAGEMVAWFALDAAALSIDGQLSGANTRANGGNGVLMRSTGNNLISAQMVTTILMTSISATPTLIQALSLKKQE